MGFVTGMKSIEQITAPREQREFARKLKLDDGQSVTFRIMGELDEESPNYDPKRGLSGIMKVHINPAQTKWMKRAACTMEDEGRCWACEYAAATGAKEWRAKTRFLASLLVNDGKSEPYVAYWDIGVYRNQNYDMIKEMFLDTGSVSNVEWRLKRAGSGLSDTRYTFMPKGGPDTKPFNWPDLAPIDLETVYETIPYDQQEAYYEAAPMTASVAPEPDPDAGNIKW